MSFYQDLHITLYNQDFRTNELPDESVQCAVTSPPYWGLRKYSGEQELIWGDKDCEHEWIEDSVSMNYVQGNPEFARPHREKKSFEAKRGFCSLCGAWKGAYGLEPTPEMYIEHTIEILMEIRGVLRKDGVVFLNLGDSYFASGGAHKPEHANPGISKSAQRRVFDSFSFPYSIIPQHHYNLKPKDLCLIPFRVAIKAQEDGWWVRSVIIWSKPNPMPESVTDRPTESHEYILMLTKSKKYYWDADAVKIESITYDREATRQPHYFGGNKGLVLREQGIRTQGSEYIPVQSRNIRTVWEFPTQPFSDWGYDWSSADYEGSDGKPYIASEDCPLHGQYHDWQKKQKALRDGQPNLDLPRITDIPNYLWSEPQPESASILAPDADQREPSNSHGHTSESTHDHKTSEIRKAESRTPGHIVGTQKIPASSSGCSDQGRSQIATENNNQNHKMGLSPETNQPCNSSGETLDHTDGRLNTPALTELGQHTGENRTLGDFCPGGLFSPILDHNFDIQRQPLATPDTNYKCSCRISQGSHFAVFPEKLPEICIKAASKEGDIVLDPFSGAGTTLWVAKKLNRKSVGFEISEEYCQLAVERNRQQGLI